MRNFLIVLIFFAFSGFCFSDLSSPFNFTSTVKCKDPNGNDKDKDKLKISFEITSLYRDFENISVVPETTNGEISYNGNGERIIDLRKELPFQDQFKVIPSDDGYFFVTLNFIKNDTIIFMERWYFKSISDGIVQVSQDEYFSYVEQKKNQMIYNDAYQRAVQWVYDKYAEGYTNNDLFIFEDENGSPEYIRMTCQENTIILHNHICPGTIGIKDALSSFGIKVIIGPIEPSPGEPLCYTTFRNKDYTISGNLKYWDPVHKEEVPIKNLLNDYDFYIETMVEIHCPNAGTTFRYVLNPVPIDQDGKFSAIIIAYPTLSNPNPVTKFRLVPKRSGYADKIDNICNNINLQNFDVSPSSPGVTSQQNSTYSWTYDILYFADNSIKDYLLYWQTMIVYVMGSNKIPFNSYQNYKAAGLNTSITNYTTYYCQDGNSIILYPRLSIHAQYAKGGIIFHEMAHQWHNNIYYSITHSNLPADYGQHNPCGEQDPAHPNDKCALINQEEKVVFIEGLADWASTYICLPKYRNDLLWFMECSMDNISKKTDCYSICECSAKRVEANSASFLFDIFDEIGLSSCHPKDNLNGYCVDGIDKDEGLLVTIWDIINIGYCSQQSGFIGLWDELYGNPYLCPLAILNGLELDGAAYEIFILFTNSSDLFLHGKLGGMPWASSRFNILPRNKNRNARTFSERYTTKNKII